MSHLKEILKAVKGKGRLRAVIDALEDAAGSDSDNQAEAGSYVLQSVDELRANHPGIATLLI